MLANKKKRTYLLEEFVVPLDHWVKIKESENIWKNKIPVAKEVVKNEGDAVTKHSWSLWYFPQEPGKLAGEIVD